MSWENWAKIANPSIYNCQTAGLDVVLPESYVVPLEVHRAFAEAHSGLKDQVEVMQLYNWLLRSVWGERYDYNRDVREVPAGSADELRRILVESSELTRPVTVFVRDDFGGTHAVSVSGVRGDDESEEYLVSQISAGFSPDISDSVVISELEQLVVDIYPRLLHATWGDVIIWPQV